MMTPHDRLTTAAAIEYRATIPARRCRAPDAARDDVSRFLTRSHIIDALASVPADALAAHVALELGDDAEAHYRLARVVACVREAARSFDALRADTHGGRPS